MSIKDNGFTLTVKMRPIIVEVGSSAAGEIHLSGYLSELQDWLEAALAEVIDMIEEIG